MSPAQHRIAPVAFRGQEQLLQITTAARLYHIHRVRQSEIARRLGISQAGVSRLLRLAEEEGIVRTVVIPPEGLHPDLEEGLVEACSLSRAIVIDTGPDEGDIPHILGTAAARYLAPEISGGVVGFTSWSVTLREMARMFPSMPGCGVTHVVETLGDLGSPLMQHEAALSTLQMAKSLGAEAVFLRTPGVVASAALRDAALADAYVRRAQELLDKVDLVFAGVGPADFHGAIAPHDNYFSAAQLAEVREAGAAGQFHQRFFDRNGQPLDNSLETQVMGMNLDQLRRAGRRFVVAGGRTKHTAIAAALAGGWIDTLVTDVASANYLLAVASARRGQGQCLTG